MSRDDWEEYDDCEVLRGTDQALLVRMADGEELWFPRSQLHADCELDDLGDTGTLKCTRWIAEQKGLA